MPSFNPEKSSEVAAKNPEVQKPLNVQITQAENSMLNVTNKQFAAELKAAGILPELSIKGGTELDYVKNNFDKLDKSKDGRITKEEINDFIKNNKELSAEEVSVLKKTAANADSIAKTHIDAQVSGNSRGATRGPEGGISKNDLDGANTRLRMEDFAQKNFDKLDADGNGSVSADELKAYAKANEKTMTDSEKSSVELLTRNVGNLARMHDDEGNWFSSDSKGFTRHDLVTSRGHAGTQSFKVSDDDYERTPECVSVPEPANQPLKPGAEPAKPGAEPAKPGAEGQKPTKEGGDPNLKTKPETSVGDHEYTVKGGDSLWKISKDNLRAQNGGKEPSDADVLRATYALAKANNMKLTDVINPGDKLKVPGAAKAESRNEEGAKRSNSEAKRNAPEPRQSEPANQQRKPDAKPAAEKNENEPATQAKAKESAAQILNRRFSEIDKDGNNKVNRKEIEKYLNEHQKDLSADEVRALDTLAKNASKIEGLVDDEKGPENSGMSRRDLEKLNQLQNMSARMYNSGMFQDLDRDRNAFLSKKEITEALTTRNLTPEQRMTLEFLQQNIKILQKATDDEKGFENNGVSNADLRFYASLR